MDEESWMPSRAWDAALLAPIAEINRDLLEALRAAALEPVRPRLPRLLSVLREDWARLDAPALVRLAACPYLLLDAGFTQPARWERPGGCVMDAPLDGSYFSAAVGVALLHRTLVLGWHLARSNRLAARLLCGMTASCSERLGGSRLQDLEQFAARAAPALAPRWQLQPQVWQQLLRAASREDARQLRTAQLRGVQLLASHCAS